MKLLLSASLIGLVLATAVGCAATRNETSPAASPGSGPTTVQPGALDRGERPQAP